MVESSGKPKFFEAKKYAVVFVCFIDILILITYAALSGVMADSLLEHITNTIKVDDTNGGKTIVITVTVVTCIVSIFFEFVGIIGSLLENFILIAIYFAGALLEFLFRLIYTIYDGEYAGMLIWELATLIAVVVFGYDLYRIKRQSR